MRRKRGRAARRSYELLSFDGDTLCVSSRLRMHVAWTVVRVCKGWTAGLLTATVLDGFGLAEGVSRSERETKRGDRLSGGGDGAGVSFMD